jgi:hypothetical protein
MMNAPREMMYLPNKDNLVVETTDFHRMKKILAEETRRAAREEEELDKDRPSLRRAEERIECPTVKVKKNERDRRATDRKLESLCPLPSA